jgi:hypothetical protein
MPVAKPAIRSILEQRLKAPSPFPPVSVTVNAMLLLAAAAMAVQATPEPSAHNAVAPAVQARATVRVLVGARLQLGQRSDLAGQRLRWTTVATPDGIRRASLVEFE